MEVYVSQARPPIFKTIWKDFTDSKQLKELKKEHSVYFSGKGGTPLPCLETFHGDEAFSEKVWRECFFLMWWLKVF